MKRALNLVNRSLICAGLVVLGLILTGQSFAKIDPETIVGMWLFDEGEGKIAKDSSGNGNDGEIKGDANWIDGKFGKALEFDGTEDRVETDDFVLSNPFSVSLWYYVSDAPSSPSSFFGKSGKGANGVFEFYDFHDHCAPKRFTLYFFDASDWGSFCSNGSFKADTWHHLAAVVNASTVDFYLDGILDVTHNYPSNIREDSSPVVLGYSGWNNAKYFCGLIDEAAVFNVTLTEDNIKTIMTDGLNIATGRIAVSSKGKLAITWGKLRAS